MTYKSQTIPLTTHAEDFYVDADFLTHAPLTYSPPPHVVYDTSLIIKKCIVCLRTNFGEYYA